jgi:hypothetical protein
MAVSSHPEPMHVIAFIESRHATARALQGARGDDPVRREAQPIRRQSPARPPRRDLLRYVPIRAR